MQKDFDVVGIGNTLVDILLKTDDICLEKFSLKKGFFNPVDGKKIERILEIFGSSKAKIAPAGSCSNTIIGIANLGGRCALLGKVGKDSHGDFYVESLKRLKVHPNLSRSNSFATGKCICLITQDAQRTFAVNLGAAMTLEKADIDESCVEKSKLLHLTAYELEVSNTREAVLHAMETAKNNGVKISIDLADASLIKRCHSEIRKIVKNYADFLFANEAEAAAFTGKSDPFQALEALSKYSEIAIVKIGEKGSLINSLGKIIKIPAYPANVVDTTGAGDLYAAGFLWASIKEKPIETCGKIGAFMASKVISQVGAVIEEPLLESVQKIIGAEFNVRFN